MSNIFNEDFREFIDTLNKSDVDYILVGGYAVILHGYVRTTGDMDIWVERVPENYHRLVKAFELFGMPVFDMTLQNFMDVGHFDVFSFGRPPRAIDIMTSVKGLEFRDALAASVITNDDGLSVRFLHLNHLLQAKKASNRFKDMDDVGHLE
jgi:hypothetical protein